MLILFPLTAAAVLFLQYSEYNSTYNYKSMQSQSQSQSVAHAHQNTKPILSERHDPDTKQRLRLWRDGASDSTVLPTGIFDYQGGICNAKLECTVYFPHADLSDLIQPDELLIDTAFTNSRTFNTQGVNPVYDPPRLVANYSQYMDPRTPALLTRRGYKGHDAPNQDRIVMLRQGDQRNIMALFDGHGSSGHDVAHAAALAMLQRLSQVRQISESTLSLTFLKVDRTLPKKAARHSGCTAIVLVHDQNSHQVLVANAGDSQALIAEYNVQTKETTIVYQTRPHKPHMPVERDRIQAAGGHVMLPERPGESSRVIIPMGQMEMALAMSRSLGDEEGKRLGILTATPTVDRVVLDANKLYFAVAASDGIFDCMNLEDVAKHVGKAMYSPSSKLRPMDACEQLIVRSSNIWKYRFNAMYRDDISIMVSKL